MTLLTVAQLGYGGGLWFSTMAVVKVVRIQLHHAVLVLVHRRVHATIDGRRFVRLL